jgi:hypothetical protein
MSAPHRGTSTGSVPALAGAAIAVIGLALAPSAAFAQERPLELSVSSTLSATNNGASSASGSEQRDLFLAVRPAVSYIHNGSGLRVRSDFGVDLFASKNGTRDNKVFPFVTAKADATVVDNLFSLASSLDVHQIERDPFAARVAQGSPENALTLGTFALSPTVFRELTADMSLLARLDLTIARSTGGAAGINRRLGQATVRLEHKPSPLDPLAGESTWRDSGRTLR